MPSRKELYFLMPIFILDFWVSVKIAGFLNILDGNLLFDNAVIFGCLILPYALINTFIITWMFNDAKRRGIQKIYAYGFLILAIVMPTIIDLGTWLLVRPALPSIPWREKVAMEKLHQEELDKVLDNLAS